MSLAAIFLSTPSHPTMLLELEYAAGDAPVALLADLSAIGWRGLWAPTISDRQMTITLGRKGRGLNGEWTRAERPKIMASVRRVLRRYGLSGVPTADPADLERVLECDSLALMPARAIVGQHSPDHPRPCFLGRSKAFPHRS